MRALSCCALTVSLLAAAGDGDGWDKVDTVDGVTVYRRSLPDSPIKSIRGVGVVEVSVAAVAAILLDEQHSPDWIDSLAEAKVVRHLQDNEYVEYNHVTMPIVSDRDFVTLVHLEPQGSDGTLLVTSKPVSNELAPEKERVVRGALNGRYLLEPIDEGRHTRLTVELHADPKGSLPAFVVNFFQKDWAHETLVGIRKQAAKHLPPPAEFAPFFKSLEPPHAAEDTPEVAK